MKFDMEMILFDANPPANPVDSFPESRQIRRQSNVNRIAQNRSLEVRDKRRALTTTAKLPPRRTVWKPLPDRKLRL